MQIQKIKQTNNFTIDWSGNGHREVQIIDDLSQRESLTDADLNMPVIVKDMEAVEKLLAEKTKATRAIGRFIPSAESRFKQVGGTSKSKSVETPEFTMAPMMPSHGPEEFDAIWNGVVPPKFMVDASLPSLRNVVD